jgi:Protein of unknown function (DUF3570)
MAITSVNSRKLSRLRQKALLVPLASIPASVSAQQNPQEPYFEVQYFFYDEWQKGEDRMSVHAPMAYFQAPLGKSWSMRGSAVVDSMSGASPLYHDSLSGASGLGINDERTAGDLAITKNFGTWNLTVGTEYSDENDYTGRGAFIQANVVSDDKLTTLSSGLSGSFDTVTSSQDPTLDESRNAGSALLGITQIIDKYTLLQSNITYTARQGYLTDQYKPGDNRPQDRSEGAWLTRLVHYIDSLSGSLHLDYRFFYDSWKLSSQMVEASWYQELSKSTYLRPLLRYYTQSNTSFFSPLYPPSQDGFYSADQRTGAFGSWSAGLKFKTDLAKALALTLSYECFHQEAGLRAGGKGSASIPDLFAHFFGVGLISRW